MDVIRLVEWNLDSHTPDGGGRELIDSIIDDLTQANVDLRTVTLDEMKSLITEACRQRRRVRRWMAAAS
jgi:hypothetical protein